MMTEEEHGSVFGMRDLIPGYLHCSLERLKLLERVSKSGRDIFVSWTDSDE